jgi:hypothetical protein
MLDKQSKIFFVAFFFAIAISIIAIYVNVMILENFDTFTEDDEVPEPTQVYRNVFNIFQNTLF